MRIPSLVVGVGLVVTIIGVFISSPALIVAGVATGLVGLGSWVIKKGSRQMPEQHGMGEEARWLTRPLRELRDSLVEMAKRSDLSIEAAVVAQEALHEADSIMEKANALVVARSELKKTLKGRGEAETQFSKLQRQYKEAGSEAERSAIESAINARQAQLNSMDLAQAKIKDVESQLKMAEATLSEVKARLSVGLATGNLESHQGEFDDMVKRLKSVGNSFEEARAILEAKDY